MMRNLLESIRRREPLRAVTAPVCAWTSGTRASGDAGGMSQPANDHEVTWSIGRKVMLGVALIIVMGLAPLVILYSSAEKTPPGGLVMLAYLLVAVFLIVSIALGCWLARYIRHSIEELRTAVARVAQGDLRHRGREHGRDELASLARSFNRMVAQLEATTVSKEELKHVHDTLLKRTEELTRSNVELDQFASVVSHDLQEPLRMITAYVHLLQTHYAGKLDKDADEFIGFAVDGARRMQGLIDDLLAYSRVGTRGKEFTATDCNEVLALTLMNLKKAIDESGARITYDQLPTVLGDEFQLGQLLQNLIGNAIKYHGEKPAEVHLGCQRVGQMWRFAVKDNGIGINPEYAQRIFVIFQRLHTRQEYPGTGIGLAICKKIVERHRGEIWVESEPARGATFYFTLPVAQAGEPANARS